MKKLNCSQEPHFIALWRYHTPGCREHSILGLLGVRGGDFRRNSPRKTTTIEKKRTVMMIVTMTTLYSELLLERAGSQRPQHGQMTLQQWMSKWYANPCFTLYGGLWKMSQQASSSGSPSVTSSAMHSVMSTPEPASATPQTLSLSWRDNGGVAAMTGRAPKRKRMLAFVTLVSVPF